MSCSNSLKAMSWITSHSHMLGHGVIKLNPIFWPWLWYYFSNNYKYGHLIMIYCHRASRGGSIIEPYDVRIIGHIGGALRTASKLQPMTECAKDVWSVGRRGSSANECNGVVFSLEGIKGIKTFFRVLLWSLFVLITFQLWAW